MGKAPRAKPMPVMRRPAGQQPHPLLVDCVVYVAAGRDDAETEQRIAEACAAAGVEPGRAVACIEQPPAAKQDRRKAHRRTRLAKGCQQAGSRAARGNLKNRTP